MPECQIRWPATARRRAAIVAVSALAVATVSCTGQSAASGLHHSHSALVVSLTDGQIRGKKPAARMSISAFPTRRPP